MGTVDRWSVHCTGLGGLHRPELGRCLRRAAHVPGIQQVLNKCSSCFPKIPYTQLVGEVPVEFPHMVSGWAGMKRKVQRPVGHTVSVIITQLCAENRSSHRQCRYK